MEVQFTAQVYLPSYYTIEEIANGQRLPSLSIDDGEYFKKQGYPLIGDAIVTIRLHTQDQIIANQLDALKQQLQTVRAENQRRENAILDQISKLQALPMAEKS